MQLPFDTRPDDETLYRAFVERDATFEGLALMGVRTTGIFCRPTCPARKPHRENVEFFLRAGDALAAGYRPCRRCNPLETMSAFPGWLQPLMETVDKDPMQRWTSQDVIASGVDPARVRRWFQAHYGMTFLAYLRARRLGQAFSRIKDGEEILEAALLADFDSVSGFCDALHRHLGKASAVSRNRLALKVAQVTSPLGPIMVAGDEKAVYLVEFWDRRMLETQFAVLQRRIGAVFFPGSNGPIEQMREELDLYFLGRLPRFETPIEFPGTQHQERVWKALLEIPRGQTFSYSELATRVGKQHAVRSVARAVGENRLAIVVPCHRIVGADGSLTGYGGGVWRKRYLLAHEGISCPVRPVSTAI